MMVACLSRDQGRLKLFYCDLRSLYYQLACAMLVFLFRTQGGEKNG